ncbi:MAG: acylphosphatase, partial [Deltaproteobacteria bacterium]
MLLEHKVFLAFSFLIGKRLIRGECLVEEDAECLSILNPAELHQEWHEDSVLKRKAIEITGIVQGIGYRPFVYNLALTHSVRGWVLNNERGVLIDAEGEDEALDRFIKGLAELAPPLARIETLKTSSLELRGYSDFEIRQSREISASEGFTLISPDVATCDACLAELFSLDNFRHRYPFINCTLCGPRFTIIKDIPYDRHKTTMAP